MESPKPPRKKTPGPPALKRGRSVGPYALGLDTFAGSILSLLLWELRMSPITYVGVGFALATCICVFIWLLPMADELKHAVPLRIGGMIIAMVLLGGVLIPQGMNRFGPSSANSMQTKVPPPTIGPITNQSGNVINVPGNNNLVTVAPLEAQDALHRMVESLQQTLSDPNISSATREIVSHKIDLAPFFDEYLRNKGTDPKSQQAIAFYNRRLEEAGKTWRVTSENIDNILGGLFLNSRFDLGESGMTGIRINGGGGNVFEHLEVTGKGTGVDLENSQNNRFDNATINEHEK